MADTMTIEILKDGSIKIDSGPISAPNHTSAEKLIAGVVELAGGVAQRKKKAHAQKHEHSHTHHHN